MPGTARATSCTASTSGRPGETVTLLGRNGVGKTTTLRAIMGIVRKRTGTICFDGQRHDAAAVAPDRRAGHRLRAGGTRHLREPDGRGESAAAARRGQGGMALDEIYALFPNLAERRHSPGTKLSGGEQQMLAIARILRTGVQAAAAGRADRRPGTGDRAAHRRGVEEAQGARLTMLLVEQNFRFAGRSPTASTWSSTAPSPPASPSPSSRPACPAPRCAAGSEP